MARHKVKACELEDLAAKLGLAIQHDCGGYRVTLGCSYVFPATGICPTATKRECMTFLMGALFATKLKQKDDSNSDT